jgi:hypothetical protein
MVYRQGLQASDSHNTRPTSQLTLITDRPSVVLIEADEIAAAPATSQLKSREAAESQQRSKDEVHEMIGRDNQRPLKLGEPRGTPRVPPIGEALLSAQLSLVFAT